MRKLKELILITLIIIIPCKVMALEGTFEVECTPTQVMPGEEVSCSIKGTSTDTVNNISANLSAAEGLEIVGFNASSEWASGEVSASNDKISVYGNGASGNFNIGTLKLKVSDTASDGTLNLNFTKIEYWDSLEESNNIGNKQVPITVKNEVLEKGLKSLSVEGYTLGPSFSPETYGYTLVINSKTFKINAVPANANDTVTIYDIVDKTTPLDANNITFVAHGGTMMINIVVGTGGTGNEYNISIQRETEEYDNTLASLTVGGKTVSCDADDMCYVYLDDVSSYSISATLSDPDNFEIDRSNGGPGDYKKEGNIIIIVKPKDSSSGYEGRTYTVVVKQNSSGGNPGGGSSGDIPSNPQTGNISIFIITLILIASLIVSLNLYKKNMNYYS